MRSKTLFSVYVSVYGVVYYHCYSDNNCKERTFLHVILEINQRKSGILSSKFSYKILSSGKFFLLFFRILFLYFQRGGKRGVIEVHRGKELFVVWKMG